jgi:hypothetical protein
VIDYFALALTHGLMAIAAWRLLMRADLDTEPPPAPPMTAPEPETMADRIARRANRQPPRA